MNGAHAPRVTSPASRRLHVTRTTAAPFNGGDGDREEVGVATQDPGTVLLSEHRRHVLDVAYRILGDCAAAEDVVQDAWLHLRGRDLSHVRSPRAYLTTVVGRLALDALRSARVQRERYVGQW